MKRVSPLPSSNLGIFSQPERSRVLWHDVKVFPSAVNVCVGSIVQGTYGKLPSKLAGVFSTLQKATIKDLISIENISILQKIELNALSLSILKLSSGSILSAALHFMEPLLKEKQIKVENALLEKDCFSADVRYGETFIQNMLFLGQYFAVSGSIIHLESKKSELCLTVPTTETAISIKKNLDPQYIYHPKQATPSLPPLLYWVNTQLAERFLGQFKYSIRQHFLTLTYAQK